MSEDSETEELEDADDAEYLPTDDDWSEWMESFGMSGTNYSQMYVFICNIYLQLNIFTIVETYKRINDERFTDVGYNIS